MFKILATIVLLLISLPAVAQDIPLRSQSNIMLQIYQVDRTLARAGGVNTAVVYGTDAESAQQMEDILSSRGLSVSTVSRDDFANVASDYSVAYFTPDADAAPDVTADNGVLSIGVNEDQFDDGDLSICFALDDNQQLLILVNRNQLDEEGHEMESGFFDLERVVASN